jgi:hypothetical protein
MFQRLTFAAVLVLSLFAGTAQAQEAQSLGFYLIPKEGVGTIFDPIRPKYVWDYIKADPTIVWGAMDLGIEPTFLVGITLTPAQHAFVTAQSDVFAIPALETEVGGNPALNRTRNGLEQRNIPGAWVQATTTWRQVVREIGSNCLILQRLQGRHQKRLFEPGVSLDSVPSQQLLADLIDVAASFGLNTGTLSISATVRDNLQRLTVQMPVFFLAGEVF